MKKFLALDSCLGQFNFNRTVFINPDSKIRLIGAEIWKELFVISKFFDENNGLTFDNAAISSEVPSNKLNSEYNNISKSFEAMEDVSILATNLADQAESDSSFDNEVTNITD